MDKDFIRMICLYLFTLVGLVVGLTLTVVGSVSMVNLGLRSLVFTEADEMEKAMFERPVDPPIPLERIEEIMEEPEVLLTEEEIIAVRSWLADHNKRQEAVGERSFMRAQRSREISQNIAMILIGVPLYFYHWKLLKKGQKEKDK